jgi:chromosome partitioning protein
MNILSIANQKGGVGKTTTSINLGIALARKGLEVLLIDLDPQGHLTEGLGIADKYLNASPNLYDLLLGEVKEKLSDIAIKVEGLEVVPSNIKLFLAEQELIMQRGRELKLSMLIKDLPASYDWIVIDCPPSLGQLTDNALYASRNVLIPIQAEDTSVRALEILFDQIQSLEQALRVKIEVLGILPNMVEDTRVAKRILDSLKESIPAMLFLEVRKRVKLKEAWAQGKSIFKYDEKSDLIPVYESLAEEIVQRVRRRESG